MNFTLASGLLLALIPFTPLLAPSGSDNTCSAPSVAADKNIVETAVAAGKFNTLAAALKAAGLVETLSAKGPFTVFAPTDEAFAKLPKGTLDSLLDPKNKAQLTNILTYHVAAGDVRAEAVLKLKNATALNGQRIAVQVTDMGVQVAGVKVIKTDIVCANGVIHVIDAVMMPATKNVVETAVGAGQFNTLAAALKAAGLVDALSGPGPFTVFAPTDEAFAKLPKGTLEELLKPENKAKLVEILKFHVVSGRAYSDQLKDGGVATLLGKEVPIRLSGKSVNVGESKVVKADIETSNGVIHVIDSVLLPK